MKPNKKANFMVSVADVLAGAVAPDAAADQLLADAGAVTENTEPSVTVVEPGLAQGLTAHEREQAIHAMNGGKTPGVNPLSQLMRDAAAAKVKTPTVRKAAVAVPGLMNGDRYSAKASHPGKCLWPVAGKMRKDGDAGQPGLKFIAENPGVTYEKFVEAGFGINHLNWDINRKWVELADPVPAVGEGEAASE